MRYAFDLYLASSWRNPYHHLVAEILEMRGISIYDYRQAISTEGHKLAFNWTEIDPEWEKWSTKTFIEHLNHPLARNAFESDHDGMMDSEACLLLLPCGRSAHLEAGFMKGMGRKLYILSQMENDRPELTYSLADGIFTDINGFLAKYEAGRV